MFGFAAIFMLILGMVLDFILPVTQSYGELTYKELMKSVISIIGKYKTLRTVAITRAIIFAIFNIFWTTLTIICFLTLQLW